MPSASVSSPLFTRERMVIAGLLLFTTILRGGVLWAMRGNLQQDPDAYREIAENILSHGVFGLGKNGQPMPTAYRPPLYPILLSNLPVADGKHVSLVLVAAVHVLLGVGTVWLTYLAARRMVGSSRREEPAAQSMSCAVQVPPGGRDLPALLAALLVACDPILLNQQTLVMTETLATFLAILAIWCLARYSDHRYWWNAGLAGGAIGLAALARPTFLPWLGLVGCTMIADCGLRIAGWRSRGLRALANVAALAVAAAALMSPWAYRNYREFGSPILTTTHGGYTMYLGNNRWFYHWLETDDSGTPWVPPEFLPAGSAMDQMNPFTLPAAVTPQTELVIDANYYELSRDDQTRNKLQFVWSCVYRIRQLWSPLPHKLTADESTGRRLLRYATAVWYCGVYALAAVGIWRLRWRLIQPPWIWGALLCLTFTAVHTLYWCNLRMRAPLMPFVALVAGAGLASMKPEAQAKEVGKNAQ